VEEDPAGMELREGCGLLTRAKGWDEAKKKADGQDKDTEGDGFVTPVDQDEGSGENEAEEGLGLVGVDREGVVSGVEHLGQRDEVEEERGGSCGDGDVAPARAIVERGRQHRKRGYAVEKNRDSEPEE